MVLDPIQYHFSFKILKNFFNHFIIKINEKKRIIYILIKDSPHNILFFHSFHKNNVIFSQITIGTIFISIFKTF